MLFQQHTNLSLLLAASWLVMNCYPVPFVRSIESSNYHEQRADQRERFIRVKRQADNELPAAVSVTSQQQAIPAANPGFEAAFQGECGQIESNQSNFSSSSRNPCEHVCLDLHDGTYECSCFYGFALAVDGYSCTRLAAESTASGGGDTRGAEEESSRRNGNQTVPRGADAPPATTMPNGGGNDNNNNSRDAANLPGANAALAASPTESRQTNFSSLLAAAGDRADTNWPATGQRRRNEDEDDDDNRNRKAAPRTMTRLARRRPAEDKTAKASAEQEGGRRDETKQVASGMQVGERKLANARDEDENNLALGELAADEEAEEEEDDDDDNISAAELATLYTNSTRRRAKGAPPEQREVGAKTSKPDEPTAPARRTDNELGAADSAAARIFRAKANKELDSQTSARKPAADQDRSDDNDDVMQQSSSARQDDRATSVWPEKHWPLQSAPRAENNADRMGYRLAMESDDGDDDDDPDLREHARASARPDGSVLDDQPDDRGVDSHIKSIMLANDKLLGQLEIELSRAEPDGGGAQKSSSSSDDDDDDDDEAGGQQQQTDKARGGLGGKLAGKSKRSSENGQKINGSARRRRKVDGRRERFHHRRPGQRQQFLDYDLNLLGNLVDETILDYHNQRSAELFAPNRHEPGDGQAANHGGHETNGALGGPAGARAADSVDIVETAAERRPSAGLEANENDIAGRGPDRDDDDRSNDDKMVVTHEIWPSNDADEEDDDDDDDDDDGPRTDRTSHPHQGDLIISYENCFDMPECGRAGDCVVESSIETGRPVARCRCPLGWGGHLCQDALERSVLSFSGGSYSTLPLDLEYGRQIRSLRILFRPDHGKLATIGHDNRIQSSSLLLSTDSFAILLDSMNRIELRYLSGANRGSDDDDDDDEDNDEEDRSFNEVDKYFVPDDKGEMIPASNELGQVVTRVIGSRDVQPNRWNELIVTDASSDEYFKSADRRFNQTKSRQQTVNRVVIVTPDKIELVRRGDVETLSRAHLMIYLGGLPDLIDSSDSGDSVSESIGNKVFNQQRHHHQQTTGKGDEYHSILGNQLKDITNFVGCIKEVSLNDRNYILRSASSGRGDLLDGYDIGECATS